MEVCNNTCIYYGFVRLNECLIEFYDDLRAFHEAVPNMLNTDGIYTWFNGLGATNRFFHDVYCRVSEIDLHEFGLNTEYVEMPIGTADEKGVWDGVRQR